MRFDLLPNLNCLLALVHSEGIRPLYSFDNGHQTGEEIKTGPEPCLGVIGLIQKI